MKFKSLDESNTSPYANFNFSAYLPKHGKPGKWLPKVDNILLCVSGYHGCEDGDLLEYLYANTYEIETRGEVFQGDDKFTAQQIRLVRKCEGWNEVTARLFACDCAAHVLKIYEKQYPNDKSPRECIATARKFAHGKATREELAAALAAAWAAEMAAAWAAARASAWAAAWDAAMAAARASAWDAAWAAAMAAEMAAARAAEKKYQARRLMKLLK